MKKIALAVSMLTPVSLVMAHGTMVEPPSRQWVCSSGNIENPQDPACAAAKEEHGTLAGYDPYAVAQANANSNHRAVVPDGKLCSGNAGWYPGYDLVRDDWSATPIQADADGNFTFRFLGTAPHRTKDWIFYVTKPGYNNEALTWDNMEEFARLGDVPLTQIDGTEDGYYDMTVKLPNRTGKHVIYNVWQRSDSGEAFYTCMDVVFPGDAVDSPWKQIDRIQAKQDLPKGASVTFRLFDETGADVDRVSVELAEPKVASEWVYDLALAVNSQIAAARIGQVQADGTVTAQISASGNLVYANNANYSSVIEFGAPVIPVTPTPTVTPVVTPTILPTVTPTPDAGSCGAEYVDGGNYQSGDRATVNGTVYELSLIHI